VIAPLAELLAEIVRAVALASLGREERQMAGRGRRQCAIH